MKSRAFLMLGLAVGAACSSPGASESLREATALVQAMVDATAMAIADGLTVTPKLEALAASRCLDTLGKDLGTTTVPYSVELAVGPAADTAALFERARALQILVRVRAVDGQRGSPSAPAPGVPWKTLSSPTGRWRATAQSRGHLFI